MPFIMVTKYPRIRCRNIDFVNTFFGLRYRPLTTLYA
jgi:hypothetical protein